MEQQRRLLDELLGKDRNLLPGEKKPKELVYTDWEVCKHYVCAFCPHDLFTNTKSDLGPCDKVHDESCKAQYQEAKKKGQGPFFEYDLLRYMERLIDDLDRKIKRGLDRLETQQIKPQPLSDEVEVRVKEYETRIGNLLKQIEDLGEQGKIEESQELTKDVNRLKEELEQLKLSTNLEALGQEKRMKVCEVCGAFLVVGDTEKRTASHIEGKQHIGYALIRKKIEELRVTLKDEIERRQNRGAWKDQGGGNSTYGYRKDYPRKDSYQKRDFRGDHHGGGQARDSYREGGGGGGGQWQGGRDNYRKKEFNTYDKGGDYGRDKRRWEDRGHSDRGGDKKYKDE